MGKQTKIEVYCENCENSHKGYIGRQYCVICDEYTLHRRYK